MKLAAIVLAAGKSSRMGENKLLLPVGDRTVLEHILTNLKPYETIVVTGYRPRNIKEISERMGARVVHNPQYEEGMTTSFQVGLRATSDYLDAVFMVLSDTFGFKKTLLDEMIQKMESTGALLASPVFEGKRGHPVLIARELFPAFLNIKESESMKDVVLRFEGAHEYVAGDIWTRIDLDTPEDYAYVKQLWEKQVSS